MDIVKLFIKINKYIKIAIVVILLLILAVIACLIAGSVSGRFERNRLSFQEAKYGAVKMDNGIYIGELKCGRITGEGSFSFNSGELYSGHWENFEFQCYGTLSVFDGGVYEGEFENSKKTGCGKYQFSNGDTYEGHFSEDNINGIGEYIFVNGDKLEGKFKNNAFTSGRYIYNIDDNVYVFTYEEEEVKSVTIDFKDGTKYNGSFAEKISGNGQMIFANGDSYDGSYLSGQRNGNGEYIWKNGEKYIGEWSNDALCGKGKYIFNENEYIEGKFNNNEIVDAKYYLTIDDTKYIFSINNKNDIVHLKFTRPNYCYDGDYSFGELTGNVRVTYSSNDSYDGEFKNGVREGVGEYAWSNGAKYIGEWVDDVMCGEGTFYYATNGAGYKLVGSFANNVPIGDCLLYLYDDSDYNVITTWENGVCTKVTE